MAIVYSTSFRTVYTTKLSQAFSSSTSLTIYSGAQPTPATLISSWSSYNSTNSNFLWHCPNGLTLSVTGSVNIYASGIPSSILPYNNGTASWAVLWSSAIAYSSMGSGTIPNTYFMICPVTSNTGNGVVRLQTTTLETSTAMTILNMGWTVTATQ